MSGSNKSKADRTQRASMRHAGSADPSEILSNAALMRIEGTPGVCAVFPPDVDAACFEQDVVMPLRVQNLLHSERQSAISIMGQRGARFLAVSLDDRFPATAQLLESKADRSINDLRPLPRDKAVSALHERYASILQAMAQR